MLLASLFVGIPLVKNNTVYVIGLAIKAIITRGIIPPKAAGVHVAAYTFI